MIAKVTSPADNGLPIKSIIFPIILPPNIEDDEWEEVTNSHLHQAISDLDGRSQDILKSRWLSDKKSTLHDLAEEYEISAERVRQIENTALKKLKSVMVDFA